LYGKRAPVTIACTSMQLCNCTSGPKKKHKQNKSVTVPQGYTRRILTFEICCQLVLTRQSTFGYIAAGVAGVVPYTGERGSVCVCVCVCVCARVNVFVRKCGAPGTHTHTYARAHTRTHTHTHTQTHTHTYTVHEHKVERRFHCGPFALCDLHPSDSGV
jgi:hypothetical protein